MKNVISFADCTKKREDYGLSTTPEQWWNEWCSEQDRALLVSRLQESDAQYVRQYGLTKPWKLIPTRIQEMLKGI